MNYYQSLIFARKLKYTIPILFISALIFSIGVNVFLAQSKTFQAGLGAFSQLIIYTTEISQRYYSLILFGFNIPLMIWFWKKLKRQFVYLTLLWLIFQVATSQLLTLIPAMNDPNPLNAEIDPETGFYFGWARFLYAFIGAIIISFGAGLSFLAGASTGGTDLFVYYYSSKYKKSIGFLEIVIGVLTIFTSLLIQYFTNSSPEKTLFQLFFGITLFSSLFYIIVYGGIIDIVFPRYRKVKIEISSQKSEQIIVFLKNVNFHHGYGIRTQRSGFSNKEHKVIVTVVFYLEFEKILRQIKSVDPDAWISVVFVHRIIGNFNDTNV